MKLFIIVVAIIAVLMLTIGVVLLTKAYKNVEIELKQTGSKFIVASVSLFVLDMVCLVVYGVSILTSILK